MSDRLKGFTEGDPVKFRLNFPRNSWGYGVFRSERAGLAIVDQYSNRQPTIYSDMGECCISVEDLFEREPFDFEVKNEQ